MSIEAYPVHKLKLRNRRKEAWTTGTKLRRGISIVRTFKDDRYDITLRGPGYPGYTIEKAVKVDKLALVEVLSETRPLVALVMRNRRGYVGWVEKIKFEQRGVLLRRNVPKVVVSSYYGRDVEEVEYADIAEVYVQPTGGTWGTLVKYRKDDYYYDVYLIEVEGYYTFEVRRG